MEWSQKVDPRHSAVLVIDMQNEFCSDGSAYDKAGFRQDLEAIRAMIPRLQYFLTAARDHGVRVIYLQAIYDRKYLSSAWMDQAHRKRPNMYSDVPVCAEGSWGAEFIPELAPLPGELIVQKHRYSAFIGTDLADILRRSSISTIIITGVGTCGCVDSTARDGFMTDFHVVLVADCVAMAWGDLHRAALAQIDALFGEVRPAADVVAGWRSRGSPKHG
jgi:ureidoacrylate peracid hydrolase